MPEYLETKNSKIENFALLTIYLLSTSGHFCGLSKASHVSWGDTEEVRSKLTVSSVGDSVWQEVKTISLYEIYGLPVNFY